MNLDQIETKCFILALFIRDDGERFLLGSRAYEFVDSQLHFVANSYQNDIVEVQGNDGVMLAGQVRRGTSQPFDGYIGDQTVDRPTIEQYRRDFMKFFRKNHYYKVVYVFPDGSAVQRRNGFIVEAPEVKELYQLFPQYHISMNFEDINYYVYEEDAEGEEIYGESATLKIATSATGGLIWEEGTESEITGEGSQFTLQGTIDGNVLDSVQLKGDTFQQTYSGKNLFNAAKNPDINNLVSGVAFNENTYTLSVPSSSSTSSGNRFTGFYLTSLQEGTTYTISYLEYTGAIATDSRKILVRSYDGSSSTELTILRSNKTASFTVPVGSQRIELFFYTTLGTTSTFSKIQIEQGSTATSYEPYTGGIPAPNPDYPQEVQTVTGRQTVSVSPQTQSEVTSNQAIFYTNVATLPQNFTLKFYSSVATTNVITMRIATDTGTSYVSGGSFDIVVGENELNVSLSDADYNTIHNSTGDRIYFQRGGFFEGATINNAVILKGEYEVNLGKNLFDKDNANVLNAYIDGTTTEIVSNSSHRTIYIPCEPNTTYSLQKISTNRARNVATFESIPTIGAIGTRLNSLPATTAGTISSVTVTTPSNAHYLAINIYFSSQDSAYTFEQVLATTQIEKGSTASTYAPYFEPIELCKIGTYQDYIYKSGSDWYVRKETNKLVFDGSDDEQWGLATNSRFYCNANLYNGGVLPSTNADDFLAYCNCLTPMDYNTSWNSTTNYTTSVAANNTSNPRIVNKDYTTLDNFKAWLAANPVSLYYPLVTATDTQITNTALIAQLNALAGATTYDGQTVFAISSPNQLAILDVTVIARTGGGVVWDNYGAEWEEGTGGGPTMVNVDSIDNVYPVLTLTGPAVNPQISVLTTNTTLSYSGTVTSSQELKIDMFNKTATLNGASVVGNVSGDWVYLKPGVNRITYTTNNADAPDSTLWWQEIVG